MVDRLVQRRRTILLGFFIGHGLFYGAVLLKDVVPPSGAMVLGAISIAGWVVLVASIVRVQLFGRGAPLQARRALVDELWRANVIASKAFRVWATRAPQLLAIL